MGTPSLCSLWPWASTWGFYSHDTLNRGLLHIPSRPHAQVPGSFHSYQCQALPAAASKSLFLNAVYITSGAWGRRVPEQARDRLLAMWCGSLIQRFPW